MSHGDRPTIDVLIRTLNEEKHLGNLLNALEAQTLLPTQVIVVDSGSTDRTVEIAKAHGASVVFIPSDEFTFGRSLNYGMRATSSEFVLIASAHVLPDNDRWLSCLVEGLVADSNCALVYGRQHGNEESAFSEQQILRKWFPSVSDPSQTSPFCNNANAMIRRTCWAAYPYDEDLPGLEDLRFATQVMRDGKTIAYRADAGILHIHDESLNGVVRRYEREAHAYGVISGDRIGPATAAGLIISNVSRDWVAALKRRELHRQLVPILRFRVAQFYGALRGGKTSRASAGLDELRRRYYYPNKIENRGRTKPGTS